MSTHYQFVPYSVATVAEPKIEALPTSVPQVSGVNQTWSWKRPKWHGTRPRVKNYNRRAIIDEIFGSIKKDAECIFQHFDGSCFGAYRRLPKGGFLCTQAFHFVMSMEITLSNALDDEMWFRIGDVNIRFSKVEFALVTGLRFGNASLDPTANHTPPSSGIHQRLFNGREVKVKDIFMEFTAGGFEGCSPLDRVKIIKILFLYYQLMGVDDRNKKVENWVWTLVEDDAAWDDFPWGLYSYQFLLQHLKVLSVDEEIFYHAFGNISAFLCWAYEAVPPLAAVCAKRLLLPSTQIPRALQWKFESRKFESLKFNEFPCVPMLEITPEEEKCYQDWWPAVHLHHMSPTSLLRKKNQTSKRKRGKKKKKAEKESSNAVGNKSGDETRVGMSTRKRVSKKKKAVQVSEISPSGNSEGNEVKLGDTAAPLNDPMSGLEGDVGCDFVDSLIENKLLRLDKLNESPSLSRQEVSSVIGRLDKVDHHLQKIADNNSIIADSVKNKFEKCLRVEISDKVKAALEGAMERASAEVVRSVKDEFVGLESTIKDAFTQEIGAFVVTMEEAVNKSMRSFEILCNSERQIEAAERTQHAVSLEKPGLKKLKPVKMEQGINRALEEKVLSLEKENDALKRIRVLDNQVISELRVRVSDLEIERKFSGSIVEELRREKLEAGVMLKESERKSSEKILALEKEIDLLKQRECLENQILNKLKTERSESVITEFVTCTDNNNVRNSNRGQKRKRSGIFGADMVRAFQEDDELCIQAVCAFYSHVLDSECSNRRFYHFEKLWPNELADYLIQGDPEVPRPIAEIKRRFPHAVDICRQLAIEYFSYFIAMPRTLSVSLVCRHCCVLTDIHDVGACETSEDTWP